jgi:hypothetical protein
LFNMIQPNDIQFKQNKDQNQEANILKIDNTNNKIDNNLNKRNIEINRKIQLPLGRLSFDKKVQEKNFSMTNNFRKDGSRVLVLLEYLCNLAIFCKKKENKSFNFRLTSSIGKIYEDYLSVEDIIKRRFEIDALLAEINKRFEYNIEDSIQDNMKSYIIALSR